MQHEKIFKRKDGSAIKVTVGLYVSAAIDEHYWNYGVQYREPGKRKFDYGGDYTAAEVLETKMELWQKLKPL